MEYLLVFLEGMLAIISPCILPMLPIIIIYLTNESGSSRKELINNMLIFILGFTILFAILGVLASTFGKLVGRNILYINIIFGIIIIIMGLNYAGIFKIPFLNRSVGIDTNIIRESAGYLKSLLFGIFFALTWSPCLGPFLTLALNRASNTENVLSGALMLVIYSLGIGLPFFILGLTLEKSKSFFKKIKDNYNTIVMVTGVILALIGVIIVGKNIYAIIGV